MNLSLLDLDTHSHWWMIKVCISSMQQLKFLLPISWWNTQIHILSTREWLGKINKTVTGVLLTKLVNEKGQIGMNISIPSFMPIVGQHSKLQHATCSIWTSQWTSSHDAYWIFANHHIFAYPRIFFIQNLH